MPSFLLRLVPGFVLMSLLAGCPSTGGKLCSSDTVPAGNFTIALVLVPSGNQCVVYADGGVMTLPDGGSVFGNIQPFTASLCSKAATQDAGPQLFLAVENQAVRDGGIGPNGEFTFVPTSSQNISQTPCGCMVDLTEAISGILVPATDAGVQVDADGGLTPIAAIDGSVVDSVSPPSAGLNGCTPSCNLPCDLHYQMNGTLQK